MRKLLALSVILASPALAQQPNGTINAPIYATGYISQVGGTNVTTKIAAQPNHPTNLNIFTTSSITATWSIQLPNPGFEGQILSFSCGAPAALISITSSDGSTIESGLPTSCKTATGFALQFDQRANIWRSLGGSNTSATTQIGTCNVDINHYQTLAAAIAACGPATQYIIGSNQTISADTSFTTDNNKVTCLPGVTITMSSVGRFTFSGNNNTVENCTFVGAGTGISTYQALLFLSGDNNTTRNNYFTNFGNTSGHGVIEVISGSSFQFKDNIARNIHDPCFFVENSGPMRSLIVTGNQCDQAINVYNTGAAATMEDVNVSNNVIRTGYFGVASFCSTVQAQVGARIQNVTFQGNVCEIVAGASVMMYGGYSLAYIDGLSATGNSFKAYSTYGIQAFEIVGTTRATVSGNTVLANSFGPGINCNNCATTTIGPNTIDSWDTSINTAGIWIVGSPATTQGNLVSGATTVTGIPTPAALMVGQKITHPNIPADATIVSVDPAASSMIISAAATANVTNATITLIPNAKTVTVTGNTLKLAAGGAGKGVSVSCLVSGSTCDEVTVVANTIVGDGTTNSVGVQVAPAAGATTSKAVVGVNNILGTNYGVWLGTGVSDFCYLPGYTNASLPLLNSSGETNSCSQADFDVVTAKTSVTAPTFVSTASGNVAFSMSNSSALRDTTNGGSAMYFDVSTGGAANGAFLWRSSNAFTTFGQLDVNGFALKTGVYSYNAAAGVSCTAGTVNAATMVVSGGIVTHC